MVAKENLKSALDVALYHHVGKLFDVRVTFDADDEAATGRFTVGLDKAITIHEQLIRIVERIE